MNEVENVVEVAAEEVKETALISEGAKTNIVVAGVGAAVGAGLYLLVDKVIVPAAKKGKAKFQEAKAKWKQRKETKNVEETKNE